MQVSALSALLSLGADLQWAEKLQGVQQAGLVVAARPQEFQEIMKGSVIIENDT